MDDLLRTTKALADGNRLRALAALLEHGELCVCQVTELLGLATATVSRHLGILQEARLATSRKDGRWVYFAASPDIDPRLLAWLTEAWARSPERTVDRRALRAIARLDPVDLCRAQRPHPVSGGGHER